MFLAAIRVIKTGILHLLARVIEIDCEQRQLHRRFISFSGRQSAGRLGKAEAIPSEKVIPTPSPDRTGRSYYLGAQ